MINDMKQRIMKEIEKTVPVFIKRNQYQYSIRCPFCGDSQKDLKETHCYLKCSFDPAEPILYNCFKGNCNSHGRVGKKFLDLLGVKIDGIDDLDSQTYSKIHHLKNNDVNIITGRPVMGSNQARYIEHRLGPGLTEDDLDRFKIIWDINSIIPYITDKRVRNTLPNADRAISFLSDDKSTLIVRFFRDEEPRWKRIKIFPTPNRVFYTIKSVLDIFTSESIVVNVAEGILDIQSVYKNFNAPNSIFVATLGSNYEVAMRYIIGKGLVGSNVEVRVYIDSNISEKLTKYHLKKYKWLFNKIIIRKNILDEDFGFPINRIKLIEYNV